MPKISRTKCYVPTLEPLSADCGQRAEVYGQRAEVFGHLSADFEQVLRSMMTYAIARLLIRARYANERRT